jgi:H+-translocating NAD(P) transhydrogenase
VRRPILEQLQHYRDVHVPILTFVAVKHARPLYRPAQSWHLDRRPLLPKLTALTTKRHAAVVAEAHSEPIPETSATPYSNLTIGVVRETWPNERRVAITPQNAALLLKKGFRRVLVERGAGAEAQFTDAAYERAGVTLGDSSTVWKESDIIMKVRAPRTDGPLSEVDLLKDGATIISFMYPAQNRKVVEQLARRGVTSFAMDMVPRISRAQVFDALRLVGCFL